MKNFEIIMVFPCQQAHKPFAAYITLMIMGMFNSPCVSDSPTWLAHNYNYLLEHVLFFNTDFECN